MQQSYQPPGLAELDMAFLGIGDAAGGPGGALLLEVGALVGRKGPGGPGGILRV